MSKKIAKWCRIGQLAYVGHSFFGALHQMAYPGYVSKAVTDAEFVTSLIRLVCSILVTEAIVRIISGFAKMLDHNK